MPTKLFFADSIDDPRQTLLAGENAYVKTGVAVGSVDNAALYGTTSDHEFTIHGDVFGGYMGILNNEDTARNNHITVGKTGTVGAMFHSGIYLSGGDHIIANYGQITGSSGITMYTISTTTESSIVNYGIIHGEHTGIGRQNSDAREELKITNYGTISGGEYSFNYSAGNAVERITNKGLMVGDILLGDNNDRYDGQDGRIDGVVFGGNGSDTLYAGSANDQIYGESGTDVLSGGGGADRLDGGSGSDTVTYKFASTAVVASLTDAGINTGDAFGDTYFGVENLTGSAYGDRLYGNSSANSLNGSAGNDKLYGMGGNDILAGSSGRDVFVFNTALSASSNVDQISGFNVADDTIHLENAIFTGLATGALAGSAFVANQTGTAGDASDRIIYEYDTGRLLFDRDGTGTSAAPILFAKLSIGLGITSADFLII